MSKFFDVKKSFDFQKKLVSEYFWRQQIFSLGVWNFIEMRWRAGCVSELTPTFGKKKKSYSRFFEEERVGGGSPPTTMTAMTTKTMTTITRTLKQPKKCRGKHATFCTNCPKRCWKQSQNIPNDLEMFWKWSENDSNGETENRLYFSHRGHRAQ